MMLVQRDWLLKPKRSSRESAPRPTNRSYHGTSRLRFASIQHLGYEFSRSSNTRGGSFVGWSDGATPEEQEAEALRNAKLTGRFPLPLPALVVSDSGATAVDWELAHAWEVELQRLDVKRPSTIQRIDKFVDVDELFGTLSPFILANEDFLRMNTDPGRRKGMKSMS